MEENKTKQLIVLGNGFDIACGLDSHYDTFFKKRFAKANSEYIIDTLLKYRPNNHGSILNFNVYGLGDQQLNTFTNRFEAKFNYFDLLFMATEQYMDQGDKSWSNIEQILQEILNFVYVQCKEVEFTNNCDIDNAAEKFKYKIFNNYKFKSDNDKLKFIKFILHVFNKTVQNNDIRKALKQYEEIFGHFITEEINDNYIAYITQVKNKLSKLVVKKADILSFNYSASLLLDNLQDTNLLENWYNIHGLSRWDAPARTKAVHKFNDNSIVIPRPIFGISNYDQNRDEFLSNTSPIYQFTKSNRRKEKKDGIKEIHNLLEYNISPNINLVTIFGHSLGLADYAYFKDIFQQLNFAKGKVRFEIFYYDDLQSIKSNMKLMLKEYSHDVSMHPKDLYSKICSENRLIFKSSSEF